jgi:MFS family permease
LKRPAYILPLIVVAQFAGTSLWFASNAILPDIHRQLGIGNNSSGTITSFVQFGFIAGTLLFSILAIADRFKPSTVFFISSVLASLSNLCIVWFVKDIDGLFAFRFITGFFLAGIYPVGMKIAADWYDKGLGTALGWLVGALVMGTAFPHLLKAILHDMPWQNVLVFVSTFAFFGGLLMLLFVHDGPFRKRGQSFHPRHIVQIFRSKDFRSASFGYFGHMWEIYTVWAFIPLLLASNKNVPADMIPMLSFIIIALGALGCITGGYIADRIGSARVAFYCLLISGICCFLSWSIPHLPYNALIIFLCIWGISVAPDSPQFSALVAQTAPAEYKGTALTISTCIGFSITILSLQAFTFLLNKISGPEQSRLFMLLGPGPVVGLIFLFRLFKKKQEQEKKLS